MMNHSTPDSKLNEQTVVRQLDDTITIFSSPFYQFSTVPLGGRSTAIKLRSGGVWIFASTPLNEVTASKLRQLGPIQYIVSPGPGHNTFLAEYRAAYPQAKLIGVPEHVKRLEGVLKLDGVINQDAPGTRYGYEDEILTAYFPHYKGGEAVFYHIATKTLITADMCVNLPAKEAHSKVSNWSTTLLGGLPISPDGMLFKRSLKAAVTDDSTMGAPVNLVASWDIKRIIVCHGDVINEGGNAIWKDAYAAYIH